MVVLRKLSKPALKAALEGGTDGWGEWASAEEHMRYAEPVHPRSRRRCSCCQKRETHVGMANGIALMGGCELRVRRWIKEGCA